MEIIVFNNVQCAFPVLKKPRAYQASPATYSLELINIDPNSPSLQKLNKVVFELCVAKHKDNAKNFLDSISNDNQKKFWGVGPKVNKKTFKPYQGYDEGKMWLSVKGKQGTEGAVRPQIIRSDGKPAVNEEEAMDLAGKIYGGCKVNVALKPFLRVNYVGVSCELVAVQFANHGEPFGESSDDVEGLFGAVDAPQMTTASLPDMFGGGAVPGSLPPGLFS